MRSLLKSATPFAMLAIAAAGILTGTAMLVNFMLGLPTNATGVLGGTQGTFGAIAGFFTLCVSIAAVYLLNKRTQAVEKTLNHQERSELDARFAKGLELLFKEESTRLAGATILHDLAKSNPKRFTRPVIEALIEVLPSTHPPPNLGSWTLFKSFRAE